MSNTFRQFRNLMPVARLQVGDVISIIDGVATLQLPGGGRAQARGETSIGHRVFFRDGAIEGPAPLLPYEEISV